MTRFIFLKENGGKAASFKELQKSLGMNAAILSPYFIPLKDLMNLIMELETFIGKSGEHVGRSPEEVVRGFLKSGLIDGVKVESPYPDPADNTAIPVNQLDTDSKSILPSVTEG